VLLTAVTTGCSAKLAARFVFLLLALDFIWECDDEADVIELVADVSNDVTVSTSVTTATGCAVASAVSSVLFPSSSDLVHVSSARFGRDRAL